MKSIYHAWVAAFALAAAACGSASDDAEDVSTQDDALAGEFRLEGFDETFIAGDDLGKLAVFHVGSTFSKKSIATPAEEMPLAMRTHGAKFYLLYSGGRLLVVNASTAALEQTITLPVTDPADFEFASDTAIYVSEKSQAKVVQIDLPSRKVKASIDLGSFKSAGGSVEPRRLYCNGNVLFAQVARTKANHRPEQGALAVVDTRSNAVKKKIELELPKADGAGKYSGLEPDLPMVLDAKRNLLLVTAIGVRPQDTGMLFRIDTKGLAVHDVKEAQSGFQGAVSFRAPYSDLFIIYHTSTPTTSTHLFSALVKADGTIQDRTGSLVDAFDGMDAVDMNAKGTLVALANTCITGFCTKGAGVNFVDAKTRKVLPKLLASEMGFEPTFVLFH
ncbi:hypothetical protein LZC95_01740 [Pendulispora brunnea]|uniref:Uncharacterized protein n=1 Tax=Pendulispora brunnea TaxID=2905690 RepID=A0ABZ2KA93_9BACT